MAKVYRATVYYVDSMDQINDKEAFKKELDLSLERSYMGSAGLITDLEESESFEWDDDIDLNKIGATKEVYEKYLSEEGEIGWD